MFVQISRITRLMRLFGLLFLLTACRPTPPPPPSPIFPACQNPARGFRPTPTQVLNTMQPDKQADEQRLALVIGNGQYQIDPLNNPVNDAEDMTKVLRQVGFEVIQVKEATLEAMNNAIQEFGNKLSQKKGVGLFYFAGHGIQYQGQNYLFPIGAMCSVTSSADLSSQTVNAQLVLDTMKTAGNELNIVFLDACRNNPFRKIKFRSPNNRMVEDKLVNDGLADMSAPSGSLIAYSTKPGTLAQDGRGRNSPYVEQLKIKLLTPGITIDEMLRQVRVAVLEETYKQQAPGYYSELNGRFCFNGPCDKSPVPPPPPDENKFFRDRLSDGSDGPKMVWIQTGEFKMGDEDGADNEKPTRQIQIEKFAAGRYEVTFEEYDRFANATGRKLPKDKGWGRRQRPVIHVSWTDANAYAEWLSEQTGKTYRLPTEAQWEYMARAGTQTRYWWGDQIGNNRAVCDCEGGSWDDKTAPVGSLSANPFGLYDTAGNVWEWTCSQYTAHYTGEEQRCAETGNRAVRGGSSFNTKNAVRSAVRQGFSPDEHKEQVGFRVIREP